MLAPFLIRRDGEALLMGAILFGYLMVGGGLGNWLIQRAANSAGSEFGGGAVASSGKPCDVTGTARSPIHDPPELTLSFQAKG